jgi:chemotaxis protein MotB
MTLTDRILKEDRGGYLQPGRSEILAWFDDSPDADSVERSSKINQYDDGLSYSGTVGNPAPAQDMFHPLDFPGAGGNDIFLQPRMPNKVHWSVPWSDLMMTMFILFVVMFIYHSSKKEFLSPDGLETKNVIEHTTVSPVTTEKQSSDYQAPILRFYDLSKKTLQAKNLNNFASVDLLADKAVRIILTGDLLFDVGEAELRDEAKDKLEKIASLIQKTPYKVNVAGHTDNLPINSSIYPTNWELSLIRASVVARFFIEEMNIPGNKFYLSGHSYFQPVRPNTTAQNRAANRRVEIIITKERPYGMPLGSKSLKAPSYEDESIFSSATG